MENIIIYGNENSNKYNHSIEICKKNQNFKYLRTIEVSLIDKIYNFKISNSHIEIDFELLGTNEYLIWLKLYKMIEDITILHNKSIYVCCYNFHKIKNELIEMFYIFMRNKKIFYILCTQNISFIPKHIIEKFKIIKLKSKQLSTIDIYKEYCTPLIDVIIENNIDYLLIREKLYDLLTYNLDIHKCLYYIVEELFIKEKIKLENIEDLFDELYEIIKMYNNNYRPIYHLESFIFSLIINVNN